MVTDVLADYLHEFSSLYEEAVWQIGDNTLAPYNHSISLRRDNVRFANIYYSSRSSINTVLVQHTGQGCAQIAQLTDILTFLNVVQPRVGRLDVAVDVETDERPELYYNAYSGGLSRAFEISPSGETLYLGSRKSDRFLRIYRYNPPHERAHLLRFEIQYRRRFARAAAWHAARVGLRRFALSALSEYPLPLQHLGLEKLSETLFVSRKLRGNTLNWLQRQVKPAIVSLIRSGELDVESFDRWIGEIRHASHNGSTRSPRA
jgi:Putative phage replication protein RstA